MPTETSQQSGVGTELTAEQNAASSSMIADSDAHPSKLPQHPKRSSLDRQKLYTLLSLFYVGLVFSALFGANLLFARYPIVADVSGGLARTLRPDTLRILSGLKSEVELLAFLPEGAAAARARALFAELEASSDFIHARVIDPEADPVAVKEANLSEGERALLRAEGRESRLTSIEEISLAQALARVTAAKRRDVCFGVEHGERSLDDKEPGGISRAAQLLLSEGFAVRKAPLSRINSLEGCRVLVLVGPSLPLSASLQRALLQYNARGGGLFLLSDTNALDGLTSLLRELQIDTTWTFLEDPDAKDPRSVSARPLRDHPSTAALLASGKSVFLYEPFALYPRSAEALLISTSNTQAKESEALGPYPVAVAVDRQPGRVIAISDAELITNSRLSNGGNRELWFGMIDWLTEPSFTTNAPTMTSAQRQNAVIVAQALVPGIFALFGIYAWRQRGRRQRKQ
jgi:hypothetical protein